MEEQKKGHGVTWAVVVVILALVAYGGYKYTKKSDSLNQENTTQTQTETQTGTPVSTSSYRDGTYTALGSYNSPAGPEQIEVTLTIKSDVVTGASVKGLATNPGSVKMQTAFIGGFEPLVVGRKITELSLTKVSGSSLTPKGWNDAVAKIQTQAKV